MLLQHKGGGSVDLDTDNLNSVFREINFTLINATSSALFIEFYFFNDQSSGQMQ